MDYTIEKKDELVQEAQISVPAAEVEPLITEKLKEIRKHVSIPGFRKGKAPLDLIRGRYLKDAEEEVFEELINQKFSEIVVKENFNIVGSGMLRHLDWQPEDALHAIVEFQLQPTVTIQKLDGLRLEKPVYEVSDDQVEETLEMLRERQAVVKEVEDGARPGHLILADFQETDDKGFPIIGKKLLDRQFQLGSGKFGEQFDAVLEGIKKGEERNVTVTYESSPGKTEVEYYKVVVKKVEERILPELDDDFAASVGDFANLDELKADIRKRLEQDYRKRSEDALQQNIIDELLKNNPFEIPPLMVDMYLADWLERLRKEAKGPINERELVERNRPYAIRNIRWYLLRDEIIKQEKLEVTDDEVEAYLDKLAEDSRIDRSALKRYYGKKQNRDDLIAQLEDEKIFERILKTAEIVEVDVSKQTPKLVE